MMENKQTTSPAPHSGRNKKEMPWGYLLIALLPSVSLFIFPAFSMYYKSAQDFIFGVSAITRFALLGCAAALVLGGLVAFLLPKNKVYLVYASLTFSVGLCLYLQYNFLNPRFGVLDGTVIDWSRFGRENLISVAVWVLCTAASLVLVLLFREKCLTVMKFAAAFVVAIQVVTVVTLAVSTPRHNLTNFNVTNEHRLDVSDDNIVVFVVDSVDQFIYDALRDSDAPEVSDEKLEDFVSFNNCVSGGGPTQFGLPLLLTGQPYTDLQQPYNDYLEQSYQTTRLYQDLSKNGYHIGLYTPTTYLYGAPVDLLENVQQGQWTFTSPLRFAKTLYKFCGFFTLPQPVKQYFWGFTDQFNQLITLKDYHGDVFHWSTQNDQDFYRTLTDSGLSYKAGEKNYRFYHMVGAHAMDLNENMEMDANSTYEQETRGEFMLIETYIRQLKELGVYDNTTIVITADHGIRYEEVYAHPMVLVKPKGHTGPYEESSAPIQFMQFPATVASQFLTDHSQYGPSYFEVDENSQPDRYQVVHPSIPKYAGILEDDDPDGKAVMFVFHGNVADNQFELVTTAESGKN